MYNHGQCKTPKPDKGNAGRAYDVKQRTCRKVRQGSCNSFEMGDKHLSTKFENLIEIASCLKCDINELVRTEFLS